MLQQANQQEKRKKRHDLINKQRSLLLVIIYEDQKLHENHTLTTINQKTFKEMKNEHFNCFIYLGKQFYNFDSLKNKQSNSFTFKETSLYDNGNMMYVRKATNSKNANYSYPKIFNIAQLSLADENFKLINNNGSSFDMSSLGKIKFDKNCFEAFEESNSLDCKNENILKNNYIHNQTVFKNENKNFAANINIENDNLIIYNTENKNETLLRKNSCESNNKNSLDQNYRINEIIDFPYFYREFRNPLSNVSMYGDSPIFNRKCLISDKKNCHFEKNVIDKFISIKNQLEADLSGVPYTKYEINFTNNKLKINNKFDCLMNEQNSEENTFSSGELSCFNIKFNKNSKQNYFIKKDSSKKINITYSVCSEKKVLLRNNIISNCAKSVSSSSNFLSNNENKMHLINDNKSNHITEFFSSLNENKSKKKLELARLSFKYLQKLSQKLKTNSTLPWNDKRKYHVVETSSNKIIETIILSKNSQEKPHFSEFNYNSFRLNEVLHGNPKIRNISFGKKEGGEENKQNIRFSSTIKHADILKNLRNNLENNGIIKEDYLVDKKQVFKHSKFKNISLKQSFNESIYTKKNSNFKKENFVNLNSHVQKNFFISPFTYPEKLCKKKIDLNKNKYFKKY